MMLWCFPYLIMTIPSLSLRFALSSYVSFVEIEFAHSSQTKKQTNTRIQTLKMNCLSDAGDDDLSVHIHYELIIESAYHSHLNLSLNNRIHTFDTMTHDI